MPETPPVLILLHRRADLAVRVLHAVRRARPSRLFLAADGPRENQAGEAADCQACRSAIEARIDWPCRVERLYRDDNHGVRRGIPESISWFFSQVEEGIILEEDVLPGDDFFRLCAELLPHYRTDTRVWNITGSNQYGPSGFGQASYAFTLHSPIWGWATWRRAWERHDPAPTDVEDAADPERLKRLFGSDTYARHWSDLLRLAATGQIQTWDYLWRLTLWKHGGLAVIPRANLVSNIGFDARALHGTDPLDPNSNRRINTLDFPLRHPAWVADNPEVTRHRLEQGYRKHRTQPWMRARRRQRWLEPFGRLARRFLSAANRQKPLDKPRT